MKLPDFRQASRLNELRGEMKAWLVRDWHATLEWEDVDWDDARKLKQEGVQIELTSLELDERDTFEYADQTVLVYIKEQSLSARSTSSDYKFHLTWCPTLQQHRRQNEYKRKYVVTTRSDGQFPVRKMGENESEGEERLVTMEVCKHCLRVLNYKGYRDTGDQTVYRQFSLEEFFQKYGSRDRRDLLGRFKTFLLGPGSTGETRS